MIAQPTYFAVNIMLLIGILVSLVIGGVLIIALWTGIKILLFRKAQKQAARKEAEKRVDSAGRPIPPSAPGICHQCGQVDSRVYHLPSGRRLCSDCYQTQSEA